MRIKANSFFFLTLLSYCMQRPNHCCKKQVRSLTDVVKGFAQNLNINIYSNVLFNYLESSQSIHTKCCSFLLWYCTFQLHFSSTIVFSSISPNLLKNLDFNNSSEVFLGSHPFSMQLLCLLKEGCWQTWGGNHFFLNNFDVKRQLCNSRWPSGDNFLYSSFGNTNLI